MRAFDRLRSRSARINLDAAAALSAYSTLAIADEVTEEADAPAELSAFWEGPVTFEGVLTGDGRMLEVDSLTWDENLATNPAPLRLVTEDVGAHQGAVTVGRIQSLERLSIADANERLAALGRPLLEYGDEARAIWGQGDFDFDSELGHEAARQVDEDLTDGVSVDLDDIAFEVRVRTELVEESDEMMEAMLNEGEGSDWTPPERRTVGDHTVVMEARPDDEIMVTVSALVRAATLVATPAFAFARLSLRDGAPQAVDESVDDGETVVRSENDADAVVAAAAPLDPPREWFADPKLSGPTPIVVTDDGRVFGHLATWDTCHVASPAGEGICVTAPHSESGYSRFHLGSLRTADGSMITVGKLTMGTGHAGPRATPAQTTAHYDNTGAAVADVRAGEDVYGIWVAGAMRPGATEEQIRALRASPLSGDWRKVDGHLELHGALAVNVPGFPVVPRPAGLVASGELTQLVAAGMVVAEEQVTVADAISTLSSEDLEYLRRMAARERDAERAATRLAVRAFAARSRVAAFVRDRDAAKEA